MHINWEKKNVVLSFDEMGSIELQTTLAIQGAAENENRELGDFARNIAHQFNIPVEEVEES